jgi:hypothetical protein
MAKKRKIKLLRIEKVLIQVSVILLLLIPASDVFVKAMLSDANI